MGTNFYAVLPIHERSIDAIEGAVYTLEGLLKKLKNGTDVFSDIEDFSNILCKEINKAKEQCKVHLGKRSGGWAFLWDYNNLWYYEPTLASIKKFIDNNNAKIVDEYNVEFTWDEFINNEIGNALNPSKAITTINELKQLNIGNINIKLIEDILFSKGLPYYQYCTSKTYYEMYPNEVRRDNIHTIYDKRLIQYAKDGIINNDYCDFITNKDGGLRFSLFSDFS